jgi:hypothetical protein
MDGGSSRSTLITSPTSKLDFAARLVYFSLAPLAVVYCTALFPVAGALLSCAIATAVFVAGESIRGLATTRPWVAKLLARELSFEAFYRDEPPRPFAYYVFYPLLFPYWLTNARARREFWLFKGYTLVGVLILLATMSYQYTQYWMPELGLRQFLPVVAILILAETLLVLSFLMPLATTVVHYHQSFRHRRLLVLLFVGLVSASLALGKMLHRRDPVVSFTTRVRVGLRTSVDRKKARAIQLAAARAALPVLMNRPAVVEGDGKVEGAPLTTAQASLAHYYKPDEALAFDLWASPRQKPKVLILYSEGRGYNSKTMWVAINSTGAEITDVKLLPKGAFVGMRHAAEE